MWNEILKCGLLVVDPSVPNPNVYYEAGMAMGLGRDTIVLVQEGVDLPADLKGKHYVEYDPAELDAADFGKAATDIAAQNGQVEGP